MYLPYNSPINSFIILRMLGWVFFKFIYSWVISYIQKCINLPVTPQVSARIIHSRREQHSQTRKWSYLEGAGFPSCRSPRCDFAQQLKGSHAGSPMEQPPAVVLLPHAGLWQAWEQGNLPFAQSILLDNESVRQLISEHAFTSLPKKSFLKHLSAAC